MHRVHYDSRRYEAVSFYGMCDCAVLVVLCTASVKAQTGGRAQTQPEATYQSIVEPYSKTFKPGMTRKEVENNLRTKNARFQQTCCFEGRRTPDDLVKIGSSSGHHLGRRDRCWWQADHGMLAGDQGGHDCRVHPRIARNSVADLRGRDLGCLAARSSEALREPAGGLRWHRVEQIPCSLQLAPRRRITQGARAAHRSVSQTSRLTRDVVMPASAHHHISQS